MRNKRHTQLARLVTLGRLTKMVISLSSIVIGANSKCERFTNTLASRYIDHGGKVHRLVSAHLALFLPLNDNTSVHTKN